MEAIAVASRGGAVGCSGFPRESVPLASGARNLVFRGDGRRAALRAAPPSRLPSTVFEDQSHVQFYLSGQCSGRKERFTKSVSLKATCSSAAAGVVEEAMDFGAQNYAEQKAVMKAKKMEIKMQKKLKKNAAKSDAGVSSSSSSSSSESEARETTERLDRTRRMSMEQLKREWESISRSPLMNSIPTMSADFTVIEQPQVQQLASRVGSSGVVQKQAEGISSVDVIEGLNNLMAMSMSSRGNVDDRVISNASAPLPVAAGVAVPLNIYSSPVQASPARVEVCMGGKCKKAGALEVLSAFEANGVTASACNKCMKKCKLAINVRVHQDENDNPQMHSGISVQDANTLSKTYFGIGAAPRAQSWQLPSFGAAPAFDCGAVDTLVH